jgi:hypothetical protein
MPVENSVHRLFVSALDDHEARAVQLEAIGRHRLAERIRACRAPSSPYPNHTCKIRGCPSCDEARAYADSKSIAERIVTMEQPGFFLATLPSKSLDDLGTTIALMRRKLVALRRLKCFRNVRSCIGTIEPPLADCKAVWAVHAHLVLDVAKLDLGEVDRAWKRLTEQRGEFKPHPRKVGIKKSNATRIARYIRSSEDWCPRSDETTPRLLEALLAGTKNKHHLIRWPKKVRK